MPGSQSADDKYFAIIKEAVLVCRQYKPKFGGKSKQGLSLEEFQELYRNDPFYTWFGFDSPLVYAAHKAAGGMTSLYRQVGIACERLFRQLLQDTMGLAEQQTRWSYSVPSSSGGKRALSLDARIQIDDVADSSKSIRLRKWLTSAAKTVHVDRNVASRLKGTVFEVRQGYKSKDSKRQNADVGNAANAYAHSYLPVVLLLSAQIDFDVADRYSRAQWLMLRGVLNGTALTSTFAFTSDILGYDLAGFFKRNSRRIR